jgi:hypothetical protein
MSGHCQTPDELPVELVYGPSIWQARRSRDDQNPLQITSALKQLDKI